MANLYGSICLSDIPKELMKKVMTAKGEKIFLNISIGEKKEPVTFDNRTYTHYVSCAPRKEERKEGVYYGIGDLMESTLKSNIPSPEDINNAPSVGEDDGLPF